MQFDEQLYFRNHRLDIQFASDGKWPNQLDYMRIKNWRLHKQKFPDAYDGTLVRLKSFSITKSNVVFHCQPTYYSRYLVSRNKEFVENHGAEYLANPTGLTIIVISSCRTVVVTRRSNANEQNPGALYFVGGFAEVHAGAIPVNFLSDAKRELDEELGVNEAQITKLRIIGLAYDPVILHPELTLIAELSIDFNKVQKQWHSAKDQHEADSLYGISIRGFVSPNGSQELPEARQTWSYKMSRKLFIQEFEQSNSLRG